MDGCGILIFSPTNCLKARLWSAIDNLAKTQGQYFFTGSIYCQATQILLELCLLRLDIRSRYIVKIIYDSPLLRAGKGKQPNWVSNIRTWSRRELGPYYFAKWILPSRIPDFDIQKAMPQWYLLPYGSEIFQYNQLCM